MVDLPILDAAPTAGSVACMGGPLHAMFVHAHPDDESSKGAGTMARYVKEGYRVSVVTLTDGARGDILNPAMDRPGVRDDLVAIRNAELTEALSLLGVTEGHLLGWPDSGWVDEFTGDGTALDPSCFYNVALAAVLERLVPLLRSTRPDVLVTYDETGGYPHPDHIATHTVSVAAVEAAADPASHPAAGEPWRVRKVYYHATFTRRRVVALHEAALAAEVESPYGEWLEHWGDRADPEVTTSVDVGDHMAQARQALLAHRTQIDPGSSWFALPEEMVRSVWPHEDYVLARSDVATTLPEDTLFAGLE